MIVLLVVLTTSTMTVVKSADQHGDDMEAYYQNHLRQQSRDNNGAISDPGNTMDTVAQNVTDDTSDTIELEDGRIAMELTSPIDLRYVH